MKVIYIILLLYVLFFFSCKEKKSKLELENLRKETGGWIISEKSIADIKIGDRIENLKDPLIPYKLENIESEGVEWEAVRLLISDTEWILAEDSEQNGFVTRITTNLKRAKTINYKIGIDQTLSDIINKGEKVNLNLNEGVLSLRLEKEKISVELDSISTEKFYSSKEQRFNDIPKNARIELICIF